MAHITSRSSQLISNILIYHTDRKYWIERLAHLRRDPSTISNKKGELVEFESGMHRTAPGNNKKVPYGFQFEIDRSVKIMNKTVIAIFRL